MKTLSAPAGVPTGSWSIGSQLGETIEQAVSALRRAIELRRSLREIELLPDRELADIGLAHGEIDRLRRGDVFHPAGWDAHNIARDQLPF